MAQSGYVTITCPYLGWENIPLADMLAPERYMSSIAHRQQYRTSGYGSIRLRESEINGVSNLVTVLVNGDVWLGVVLDGAVCHNPGSDMGRLRVRRVKAT
jgi:hypothetical protein